MDKSGPRAFGALGDVHDTRVYQSLGDVFPVARNLYGSARWMKPEEYEQAGFFQLDGVVLGKVEDGRMLRFNGDGHVMVFAPTGAGKGIGLVQANLATYGGSMVVLDPKGENAIVSARRRREMGQDVIVLDPFGKTGLPSARYNPLGALSFADRAELGPMIEALADALIPVTDNTREPHWPLGAKRFISFLLWYLVAHEPNESRNLVRLFELAHSGYPKLEKIAMAMAKGHPDLDPDVRRMCIALGNWFLGRQEREFSYFESQALNNLGWIGDFVWSETLATAPSPPMPLKSKPMTVYLVLPFKQLRRYQPWLRVMVTDLINTLYDTPGSLPTPVLFLLDEAYAGLGQMESLFTAAAAVRSAGARLCFIYQDIHQVDKLYGAAWTSLIANSGATLFWSVGPDHKTGEFISHCTGSRTVPIPGNPMGAAQPLIRSEEVMQLPQTEIVGLFRNQRPARFWRMNVLEDKHFQGQHGPLLDRNTTYDVVAPADSEAEPRQPRSFVPLSLDHDGQVPESDRAERNLLAALSKEFGHPVFRNTDGRYGYCDERGVFVPVG